MFLFEGYGMQQVTPPKEKQGQEETVKKNSYNSTSGVVQLCDTGVFNYTSNDRKTNYTGNLNNEKDRKQLETYLGADEFARFIAWANEQMAKWGSDKGPSKDAFGKTIEHVLTARVLDNVTKRARSAETAKRSQESYAAGKKNFEEKNYFMVTLVPKKGGETTKEEDGETKAS